MPLSWLLQVVFVLPVTAEVFLVLALTVVVALEGSALSSLASGEPGGDEAGVELVMTGIERELAERGRRRRAVLRVRTDQPQAGWLYGLQEVGLATFKHGKVYFG